MKIQNSNSNINPHFWRRGRRAFFCGLCISRFSKHNILAHRCGLSRAHAGNVEPTGTLCHTLGGFSAHAGQTDLMRWFDVIAPSKPRVVLTNGEDDQRAALARLIQQRHRLASKLPKMGEVIEL